MKINESENEIKRIKRLMILSEASTPGPWWLRVAMSLSDASVDDLVKLAKKSGVKVDQLTAEISRLKSELDELGSFAVKKLKGEAAGTPPGAYRTFERIVQNLSENEVMAVIKSRLTTMFDNPNGYFNQQYNRLKNTWLHNPEYGINKFLDEGVTLTKQEIVDNFINAIKKDFPGEEFEDYINWIKKEVDTDPDFLAALERAGLEVESAGLNIKTLPPAPGVVGFVESAWWNWLEPYTRWWRKGPGMSIKQGALKLQGKDLVKVFEEELEKAFVQAETRFKAAGTNKNVKPSEMYREFRKLSERFQSYSGVKGGEFANAGDFYKTIWDDYIKELKGKYQWTEEQIKNINKFEKFISTEWKGDWKSLSIKHLLGGEEANVVGELKSEFTRLASSKEKFHEKLWGGVKAASTHLWSNFATGTFITPRMFSQRMAKELELAFLNKTISKISGKPLGPVEKSIAQQKAQVFAKRMQKTNAYAHTARIFAISYIVLPAIIATVSAFFEIIFNISFGKGHWKKEEGETTLDLYGRMITTTIANTFYDKQISFLDLIPSEYQPTWEEWKNSPYNLQLIPGRDWTTIGRLVTFIADNAHRAGEGDQTIEDYTKDQADKILAKEKIVKDFNKISKTSELNMESHRIISDLKVPDNLKKYFSLKNKKSTDDIEYFDFYIKTDKDPKRFYIVRNIYKRDGHYYENYNGVDENGIKYLNMGKDGDSPNKSSSDFLKHLTALVKEKKLLSYEDLKAASEKATKDLEEVKNAATPAPQVKKGSTPTPQVQTNSILAITNKLIKEMKEGKKFGEDNFKHWKDTFKFKKYDEKTNQLKDVKISSKMDEIMDRIDHFRKKYDEDDAFVRAVVDVYGTQIDIIQHTKGLAHLTENIVVSGLMSVLATLRESKELVTWTVKHYKDGNWELVKGNFNKKELLNVGKTKRERDERQKDSENPAEGLKKKEQESILILNRDEKEGLNGLPTKVKQKVKEKLRQGWTTEKPFEFLKIYYSESEINSVFNNKIKIYKLKPSAEFFRTLAKNSSKITVKKGFCKSVKNAKGDYDLNEKEKNSLNHFITKCQSKFGV